MVKNKQTIPFNRPTLAGKELAYIKEAVELGQLSGDGSFTHRCQKLLELRGVAKQTLLTHSCTAALEMAMILANVNQGDEVIMPSYTFVSTANAVCLRGAVPVFVDIDETYLCLNADLVESAITPKTKAIIMVHYAGFVSGIEQIREICHRYELVLVEDAAQALGSTYKGLSAGSLGDLSAFSFHETKNIISGEGGFLGINNGGLMERAEIVREKGTDRSKFFRGQVDKYSWVDIGSSFLPGELIAAFLYGQLEKMDQINQHRLYAWSVYHDFFQDYARTYNLQLPKVPPHCEHNGHMYFVIFDSLDIRTRFIEHMRAAEIMTPFHYVPLHNSPAGKKLARAHGDLSITNAVAERLVRLPLFTIEKHEQLRVLDVIDDFMQVVMPDLVK